MRSIKPEYVRFHSEELIVKHKKLWLILLVVCLVVLALVGPYILAGKGRPFSSDLNQLRAQFNQDRGKVRLVILLSPT